MNELEIENGLAPTPGYRYASRIGDQLFVAGQVPLDSSGEIVGSEEPDNQAQKCLENLETLLGIHDFSMEDVQQLTIYVVGPTERLSLAWQSVKAYFRHTVPPATLLGVASLGYEGQLVEIDATVIRKTES